MNAPQIILRQSFSENLFFTTRPDAATRKALREAGWKWNRSGNWWRNTNTTQVVKPKELAPLLVAVNGDVVQPEAATA